nr:putative reverse transcriptase, RNA-dependent DNA polymerase [Tanacetum cinerariifolium]
NIHETVGVQEQEEPSLTEVEEPTLTEVLEKYVLPARSNRGIPLKRYTLEKTSRSSKYHIANIARGNISKESNAFFASLYSEEAPSNVEQALKSEKLKNAMDFEMDALMRNRTWDKFAKIDTIRVLFLIATNQGWPLHHFDVKNAFLHGELKEEVYMEAPPGFSQHFKHGEVYIAYAVRVVSQFMHQPHVDHMHAVLRIVRYLTGTTNHGVLFKTNNHLNIQIFIGADWAGDKGNKSLTSGYFSLVGGNLVTWKSKKQKVVSLSSVEAEFRGIAKGLAEAMWIRKLVSEIWFPSKECIRTMSDNKAAIQIS